MDLYLLFGMGVFLLFCAVFAIIRKSFRTKFRFLTVLLSAIAAFVFTLLLKSNLSGLVDGALLPQLDIYYPEVASTLRELMGFSPTLTVLLENTACSMLAPILFLLFFIVLSAVIAYLKDTRDDEKDHTPITKKNAKKKFIKRKWEEERDKE